MTGWYRVVFALLLSTTCSASLMAQNKETNPWQALRTLRKAAKSGKLLYQGMTNHEYRFETNSLRLNGQMLEFDGVDQKKNEILHFTLPLTELKSAPLINFYGLVSYSRWHRLAVHAANSKNDYTVYIDEHALDCKGIQDSQACPLVAQEFVDALNSLRSAVLAGGMPDVAARATAWRALREKPALSADVNLHRSLAEDSIKSNKPEEALNYYELGLEIDPMWAQGWFNAAVIAAQLDDYIDAVEHMQNYLLLVPDADDADSAREQIAMWKYKAQKK